MNRHQKLRVIVRDWSHVAWRMPAAVLDRTPPDAFRQGHLAPVVMLPGIWEPWRFLLPLARALNELGHPVHPVPGLGWNGLSLEDSAEIVSRALDGEVPSPAVLVAHSKGGLIGKRVMLDEAEPGERAVGLVALCSPFGGSSLSRRILARTPLGMFAPAGLVIHTLAAELALNSRIVSIGSAWDEMVPDGTHLDGGANLTVASAGHFLPIIDHDVVQLVHEQVQVLWDSRG